MTHLLVTLAGNVRKLWFVGELLLLALIHKLQGLVDLIRLHWQLFTMSCTLAELIQCVHILVLFFIGQSVEVTRIHAVFDPLDFEHLESALARNSVESLHDLS